MSTSRQYALLVMLTGASLACVRGSLASAQDYALSTDGSTVVRIKTLEPIGSSSLDAGLITSAYPGWTVTTGGLSGNIATTTYRAGWTGASGGAQFGASFSTGAPVPAGSTLNWVQVITTNSPLGGASTIYIDPRPNDDNLPFYWTSGEAAGFGNATSVSFSDFSRRPLSEIAQLGGVSWVASLFPAEYDGATGVTIGSGVRWGWEMKKAMVGSASATFTNPTPGSAVTAGVGTSTFSWGSGEPSSLSFAGTTFDTMPNQIFRLGTLSFHNGTITVDTGADSVTFNLSLSFDNVPEKNLTNSTVFTLINTLNTSDPVESADYVTIGGFDHTFHIFEGGSASVDLLAKLSTGLTISSTGSSNDLKMFDGLFDVNPDFIVSLVGFGTPEGDGFISNATVANLLWDGGAASDVGDGEVDGGDGVWDATTPNWTDSTGTASLAYAPGSVIFDGTPGVVTVDASAGEIAVTAVQFAADGYVIEGDALTLSGDATIIQVGDSTAAGGDVTARIDAALTGTATLSKIDQGTLILNGANTYSGGTVISGGALAGSAASFGSGEIFNDAALIIDQAVDGTLANNIDGTGTLTKRGSGALRLTGTDSRTGATSVEAGTLRVDGIMANSATTVQSGATLAGEGVVGGVVAAAGSRVAPGASIGVLTVTGDYAQAAGSVLQVEADVAGASDQLLVSGSATLEPGALLEVVKTDPGHFLLGTRYTVLEALGGLTGQYTLSGDTRVSAFVDVIDAYDPSHVYLDVAQTRSFASAGLTRNQTAAGGGADTGSGALHSALAYLPTDEAARAAFDQISGEVHATLRSVALDDSRFIREVALGRLGDVSLAGPERRGAWVRAFGSWADWDGDSEAGELNRNVGGLFFGGEVARGRAWDFGVMAGFSSSSLDLDARASSASTEDYHVGAYGGTLRGPAAVRLGASYSFETAETDRSVVIPDFSDRLTETYDAGLTQLFGELGYRLGEDSFNVEPFANVAWVGLQSDRFRERGGAAALSADSEDSSVVFTTLGLKASGAIQGRQTAAMSLFGQAGLRHADGDIEATRTMSFSGGRPFTIAGLPVAEDALGLRAGLQAALGAHASIAFAYSGEIADGRSDHGSTATLTWRY